MAPLNANLFLMQHSTIASSFRGASCTKPCKDVFRTQSYIQDRAFAKIVNGFTFFRSIFDVWLGPNCLNDFTLYPQMSLKMLTFKQIVRNSFINSLVYIFFSLVVLRTASYMKPISNFKYLQQNSFLENLQMFRRVLLFLSRYFWNCS